MPFFKPKNNRSQRNIMSELRDQTNRRHRTIHKAALEKEGYTDHTVTARGETNTIFMSQYISRFKWIIAKPNQFIGACGALTRVLTLRCRAVSTSHSKHLPSAQINSALSSVYTAPCVYAGGPPRPAIKVRDARK